MQFNIVALILLQIAYFMMIGFPLCLYLSSKLKDNVALGIQTSAPIIGVLIAIWFDIIAVTIGLNQKTVVIGLFLFAVFSFFFIVLNKLKSVDARLSILKTIFIIFGITLISILLHISDYNGIETTNYFPMTNDDTFAYLGQIDQVRVEGKMLPQIEYSAGYIPNYLHAVNLRAAVTSLIAGQAELFRLDSHTAFFSTIRMTIPLVALGIFAILLILKKNYFVAGVATIFFVGGNFMLNQVLQQFLSTALGSVAAIGTIILGMLVIEMNYNNLSIGILGMAVGIFAMTSPEAHLFLIAGLLLFFMMIKLVMRSALQRPKPAKIIIYFIIGFFIGIIALFPKLYIDLLPQSQKILGELRNPGDWIAQIGFLMESSGITPSFKGEKLESYSIYEHIFMIVVSSFTIASILYFTFKPLFSVAYEEPKNQHKLFIGIIGFVILIIFTTALLTGKGYLMLKIFDYYAFIPALMLGISINKISLIKEHVYKNNLIAKTLILLILSGFLVVVIPNKIKELKNYNDMIKQNPPLNAYWFEISVKDRLIGIEADLHNAPLNMFLYVNRWRSVPIFFSQKESNRYSPSSYNRESTQLSHVFRMGYPGNKYNDYLEITRPRVVDIPMKAELVDAKNYIKLVTVGSSWLPVAGERPEISYRWLSKEGKFVILSMSQGAQLHVQLYPGPDLFPDNQIQIVVENLVLLSIPSTQLPTDLTIQIPDNIMTQRVNGAIRVTGKTGGLRQVSVAGLYIDQRVEELIL